MLFTCRLMPANSRDATFSASHGYGGAPNGEDENKTDCGTRRFNQTRIREDLGTIIKRMHENIKSDIFQIARRSRRRVWFGQRLCFRVAVFLFSKL